MSWKASLSWEDAKKKAFILSKIRAFFDKREVIEVETPLLGHFTVTDVHLEAFKTVYNYSVSSSDDQSNNMFFQTSPEYSMKRLLASGYGSIYQISKAFRDEGKGRFHNPEFTILEWYRLGFEQMDLITEVGELLKEILGCNDPIIYSYQNLFIEQVNIDPLNTSINELKDFIKNKNMMSEWLRVESNIDVLLQFILSEVIEPCIGLDEPMFIMNFPISQASLAKENALDKRVADRFECYFKGVELVNGFCELTDPIEQLKRFKQDNFYRKKMGLEEKIIDELFINALESGLPSCSGVALGIDRLIMLALNKHSIEDVITFSIDSA